MNKHNAFLGADASATTQRAGGKLFLDFPPAITFLTYYTYPVVVSLLARHAAFL